MNKESFKRKLAVITAVISISVCTVATPVIASWHQIGSMGDINNDSKVSIADMILLSKYILGEISLTSENTYHINGKPYSVNGRTEDNSADYLHTADVNQDGRIDIFDLIMMRKYIINQWSEPVYIWEDDKETSSSSSVVTATTIASGTSSGLSSATSTATVSSVQKDNFIEPPVYDLYGSMPSQGDAELLIFYVDFPDCKYDYNPTADEINRIAFGETDIKNINYPFESMNAFCRRSSKGSMKLNGTAYTYTTKNNKSYYEDDIWHVALVDEIIAEFDKTIDFSEFDGNKDKIIDSILISVPESAGNENWWASAGTFGGDPVNRADGMNIGHVIVGNAEIKSADNYSNFNSSYLHEIGHCMGLPDYYMYGAEDFQGMHGSAGFEMMDDANCDFGAVSKLMLGWYTPEQVNIFDKNSGPQTYVLSDAQTDDGNCIIIPCGNFDDEYRSEFFIIEYASMKNNNSNLVNEWWRSTGEGVRIYHAETSENGDIRYNTFKYASGNDDFTDYGNGRRFIRLVGEGDDSTDNFLRTGDIVDSSVPDFNIYDNDGNMTVNMGVNVTVGDCTDGKYYITVSPD